MSDGAHTDWERLLERVNRPSQYLGNEINTVKKNLDRVHCSIALAFPDLYDLGMSYLGFQILYHLVNREDDLAAERVFVPEDDLTALLGQNGLGLCSMESRTPLSRFDILGITIPHELVYTNILHLLRVAGIPIRSSDRSDPHPVVVGGGAAVYNPEPVAVFFDLFVIGDGEEIIVPLMREIGTLRKAGTPRAELLSRLAGWEGIYVPSLFRPHYKPTGEIERIEPLRPGGDRVKRIYVKDLNQIPYPDRPIVSYGEPIHDRISLEIDRGCTQGCRFCQAGYTYRPVRERSQETILNLAEKSVEATGQEDISLASLSSGDYSGIDPLVNKLSRRFSKDRVAVSLPSMRSGTVHPELVDDIRKVRKTGFTITAEAGTQRLRNVINKKITEETLFATARNVLAGGYPSLKIYFMIGLPTETREDLDGIVELGKQIANMRAEKHRFKNVTLSVSNFVPKPFTPFQWFPQDPEEALTEKLNYLKRRVREHRHLTLKWHDVGMSSFEGVFSRGDRRLADVVEAAYLKGCRFDEWTERFKRETWLSCFREKGLDPAFFANRRMGYEEVLPWDHLDIGVTKDFLRGEAELADREVVTEDCRFEKCLACGIQPRDCQNIYPREVAPIPLSPSAGIPEDRTETLSYKYRLTFGKLGPARFFSHLELNRILIRAVRRGKLPVAYSRGFHPHPKISFGHALPVGMESEMEYLDLELESPFSCEEIKTVLNRELPEGLAVSSVEMKSHFHRSIGTQIREGWFQVDIPHNGLHPSSDNGTADTSPDGIERRIQTLLDQPEIWIQRPGKPKPVDIRPVIGSILSKRVEGSLRLEVRLRYDRGTFAQPMDLVQALSLPPELGPVRILKKKTVLMED